MSSHTARVVWNLEHSLLALPTYCSLSVGPAQNFFMGPLLFSQGLRYDWIHIQTDAKNKITLDSTATYHVLNFKCPSSHEVGLS